MKRSPLGSTFNLRVLNSRFDMSCFAQVSSWYRSRCEGRERFSSWSKYQVSSSAIRSCSPSPFSQFHYYFFKVKPNTSSISKCLVRQYRFLLHKTGILVFKCFFHCSTLFIYLFIYSYVNSWAELSYQSCPASFIVESKSIHYSSFRSPLIS